jgi:hypothetical protein
LLMIRKGGKTCGGVAANNGSAASNIRKRAMPPVYLSVRPVSGIT